jgi:hypothetical protein
MRFYFGGVAVAIGALSLSPASANPLPSWNDQIEELRGLGDQLATASDNAGSDAARQEMYRYVLGAISNGYLNYVNMDTSRPTWAPLWNFAYNYGGANPDYVYMMTFVDPKGVYRISGYRGTSKFVEIAQQTTDFTSRATGERPVRATHQLDDLHKDKDGYFSVILSAQRPTGYAGDWWQLDAGTRGLLMRKASYDWRNEIDPRIAIDRMDDAPPMSPAEIAERFAHLKDWVTTRIMSESDLARYYREHHGINVIKKSEVMAATNPVSAQIYLDGAYQFTDDEALVLDVSVPSPCRYWQILVTDNKFTTVDWVNHQSSLNGFQARIDSDGHFRAVIAARDPGVPNWLDTAGNAWGIMQMRWNHCSAAPEPTVMKVPIAEVRQHLPPDTPVVTPTQRREQLRERREAAQFRRLW